ncbi:MAG: nuclear transport factor 2 family protein [Pseudonocardiaceae bacterium]|nr:nuclear transport factor 2 family protein [Pseudonocardiaceae bacterium]
MSPTHDERTIMTARAEFENLLGRAAWGFDENDVDLIASCFSEGARMALRIGREGDLVGPFEGREAIRKLHADSLASQTDQRRHNLTNVIVEKESAEEATLVSNLSLLSVENGSIRVLSSGWYRDQLVNEGGTWRIADRYVYLDLPY